MARPASPCRLLAPLPGFGGLVRAYGATALAASLNTALDGPAGRWRPEAASSRRAGQFPAASMERAVSGGCNRTSGRPRAGDLLNQSRGLAGSADCANVTLRASAAVAAGDGVHEEPLPLSAQDYGGGRHEGLSPIWRGLGAAPGRMEPAHVTFTASAPGRHTGLVRCCGFGRSGHLTLRLPAS
jgi:hypothetical protein